MLYFKNCPTPTQVKKLMFRIICPAVESPLKVDLPQPSVEFIEFVDLPDEEISISASNLSVSNVDHIFINIKVDFGSGLELSLKPRSSLCPHNILHFMLECKQVVAEFFRRHFHKPSHLVKGHGGVQLQVGPDGGKHQLLLDLLHKNFELQPEWLLMKSICIKVNSIVCWGNWGQKLGAGECIRGLKLGHFPPLHLVDLVCVILLSEGCVKRLVDPLWVEDEADGQQDKHLVSLLVDLIILVGLGLEHSFSPLNIQKDVGEGTDGIRIPSHHHVRKPNIVVGCDLASRHPAVEALLVQLDVLQNLDGLIEITEQRVKSQKSHEREISQHF